MECTICNCSIITNNTTTPSGFQYGIQKEDDKWYCTACSDVADFAFEATTIRDIVKSQEPVIKHEKPKDVNQVIRFYCSKCKNNATGSKCDTCGTANPLFIRRKKGKK